MSSKTEKDKAKQIQDKCQALLNEMLRDEDNKYCVDCDSKGPRWASWNLGVFLCIRCAGIHRNLGVHISKVKSVNLDSWTPEQVVSLQQMGNSRARAVYEANLPDNFRRPQSDSSLESFVRAKYEHKKYIAREWVPPVIPKVDWEKEIDEEIERQKRKKKNAASLVGDKKSSVGRIAEVPQIPKLKMVSPKAGRGAGTAGGTGGSGGPSGGPLEKPQPVQQTQQQDLLGLQNGEDGFGGFLSGPAPPSAALSAAEAADKARAEEESFFNQLQPSEKERTKLTKDNILALYGSAPPPPQPSLYPGPFPHQAPTQGFAPGYSPFPPAQPPLQNSLQNGLSFQPYSQPSYHHQFSSQQTPQYLPAASQYLPPQAAQQQFTPAPVPNVAPQYSAVFPGGVPGGQSSQFGFQPSGNFPQPQGASSASNPFFGAPQAGGLHQQFAGMSLGAQAPAAKPGAPVATNLWQ